MNEMVQDANYYRHARANMLAYVPTGIGRALEVGCAEGVFGRLLHESTGAEVWGVELDASAAAIAATQLQRVLTGPFDAVIDQLPAGYFDCVIFNDVLEHMVDPYTAVSQTRSLLSPTGVVVASIPNVLYFRVLEELLIPRDWEYKSHGVLDRTHLRFFARKSIVRLFEQHGYQIETLAGINVANSLKVRLLQLCTLGWLNEARYHQWVCVAKVAPES